MYVHPYLGKMNPFLTHLFRWGWFNHLRNLGDLSMIRSCLCFAVLLTQWIRLRFVDPNNGWDLTNGGEEGSDKFLVVVATQICCYFHSENWGRWTHFWLITNIFQMGWFNHQPDFGFNGISNWLGSTWFKWTCYTGSGGGIRIIWPETPMFFFEWRGTQLLGGFACPYLGGNLPWKRLDWETLIG